MSNTDHDIPPVLGPKPAPVPPRPASPLFARLLNVFAIPGHVFEEVRVSRHSVGNWVIPTLLCCVVLAVSGYVVLSTPTMQKNVAGLRERQATTLGEAVKAGKITQAEVDQSLKIMDGLMQPAVLKSIAAGGGFVWGVVRLFWWSFVLWLLARTFLRCPIPYHKAVEVAGLVSMIALLSTVVMLVLTVNIGESFGGQRFALSVTDITSPDHQTLASVALNVVNFWVVIVLGIGLGRLTQAPWFRATFLVVAYWLLSDLLLLLLGAGAMVG
jgi:hypothetical protein